ncbi:MAG: hypothetical protein KDA89_11200, partial [Planctomycetaceae bacterium]|nr:hypothetical protein [Planctomycetaceae bacterium]
LCVLYDPPTHGIAGSAAISMIGWVLVGILCWRMHRRNPLVSWAGAVFLLLLFPVLNFFRITTLMNDRYLYLPCICFFAVAAGGLRPLLIVAESHADELIRSLAQLTRLTASALVIGAAMTATAGHLPVWRNSESLWTHAASQVPQLTVVRIQMAYTLHDSGRRREGIRELQKALLQCQPDRLDRDRILKTLQEWNEELNIRVARQ